MFKVLYRSVDYWVVEKPAGMSFHDEGEMHGVMHSLALAYPEYTFYPVHRLDKMTSGLLIVACHAEAAAMFGKLFEQRAIEKRYVALSTKKPKKKQGTISGGMVPSRRGQWKLTKDYENFSATQFFSHSFQNVRVFYVRPLTGKTHQIRVALKSLGSPILGDVRYGGELSDRGYLHAYSLRFEWRGELMNFVSSPSVGEWFNEELANYIASQFNESQLQWPAKK